MQPSRFFVSMFDQVHPEFTPVSDSVSFIGVANSEGLS